MSAHSLESFVNSLGLTYEAKFIPQSQSRNAGENPCLNWKITFKKGRQEYITDYMQGIGHLPNYSHYRSNEIFYDKYVREACESGKWDKLCHKPEHRAYFAKLKPLEPPKMLDVLYCIITDCDVINYRGFEDWASCFGYDTDSRKAKKIYNECLKQFLELKNLISLADIEKLQQLFQDY
jgi:hypothetical protein